MEYNRIRLQGVLESLKNDGLFDIFSKEIEDYKQLGEIMKSQNQPENIFKNHNNIQEFLWDSFQTHPKYNRSISFVFRLT